MGELKVNTPQAMRQFDAFPKLPSTYRTRSRGGGFITIFVALVSFFLVVNDIAEYIWGWPDYEFNVDRDGESFMNINVDLVVNTPCRCTCHSSNRLLAQLTCFPSLSFECGP